MTRFGRHRLTCELLEETAEGRLAGDALNGQQRSQHHVPAQVGDLCTLFGPGENPGQEPQGKLEGFIFCRFYNDAAPTALLRPGVFPKR